MMIPQQQRSPAWLKWRRDKIGGSDASSIMDKNAFKKVGELWEEKLGLRKPEEENEHMARGNALEDEARLEFETLTGLIMFPQVLVHSGYPWMIASLDGMTMDKKIAVEIKCPGKIGNLLDGIPDYYKPQLQHQMAVANLDEIYFFAFFKGPMNSETHILHKMQRDDAYIKKLIEKEKQFYEILLQGFDEISKHEERLDGMKTELYRIYNEQA
jgi:putative phage-type endonuclease